MGFYLGFSISQKNVNSPENYFFGLAFFNFELQCFINLASIYLSLLMISQFFVSIAATSAYLDLSKFFLSFSILFLLSNIYLISSINYLILSSISYLGTRELSEGLTFLTYTCSSSYSTNRIFSVNVRSSFSNSYIKLFSSFIQLSNSAFLSLLILISWSFTIQLPT